MRRILTIIAMTLSSMYATPALADDQPLLLVVSDFDAAVLKDALAAENESRPATHAEQVETQKHLDKILGELRAPREQAPQRQDIEALLAPHNGGQKSLISSTNQAQRRSPNPV